MGSFRQSADTPPMTMNQEGSQYNLTDLLVISNMFTPSSPTFTHFNPTIFVHMAFKQLEQNKATITYFSGSERLSLYHSTKLNAQTFF
jgi:hypothetical protein